MPLGALALIGMVSYLAGAVQTPITSFVIVSEMTENHALIIPLMLAALIADAMSKTICRGSLYHSLAEIAIENVARRACRQDQARRTGAAKTDEHEAQSDDIAFDRSFVAAPGELLPLTPRVRRMVADNPGPMTFTGTCTYVVGQGEVADHRSRPRSAGACRSAARRRFGTRRCSHILVTHTHRDHCAAAAALKAATGAKIIGCARPSRAGTERRWRRVGFCA